MNLIHSRKYIRIRFNRSLELKKHLKGLEKINIQELKKAKKRARVNFVQDSEMVADIADSIGYWVSVCDDISLANQYLTVLNEIDCKYLEDVARKYLNPEFVNISLLLPNKMKEEI